MNKFIQHLKEKGYKIYGNLLELPLGFSCKIS